MCGRRERGATLIELTLSIVVIAIAASAVLGLLSRTVSRSADAMVMSQAVAIAESYLEEITLKSYADPDGADGEGSRSAYDDVDDYNGLNDDGVRNQFGAAVPPLAAYRVQVSVVASTSLTGVPSADAQRIDVRVTYPKDGAALQSVRLTGYKTRL
jgi:MSHA pilin protein MshD